MTELIRDNVADLSAEIDALRKQKDGAYAERDKLVALLSALYPSWMTRHPDEDKAWDDDWRWIVFMHLPDGIGGPGVQASWHIHDSELPLFAHLKPTLYGKTPPAWDGHTTDEKYKRVEHATRQAAEEKGCNLCGDVR